MRFSVSARIYSTTLLKIDLKLGQRKLDKPYFHVTMPYYMQDRDEHREPYRFK